jgi:hypothetical protein
MPKLLVSIPIIFYIYIPFLILYFMWTNTSIFYSKHLEYNHKKQIGLQNGRKKEWRDGKLKNKNLLIPYWNTKWETRNYYLTKYRHANNMLSMWWQIIMVWHII